MKNEKLLLQLSLGIAILVIAYLLYTKKSGGMYLGADKWPNIPTATNMVVAADPKNSQYKITVSAGGQLLYSTSTVNNAGFSNNNNIVSFVKSLGINETNTPTQMYHSYTLQKNSDGSYSVKGTSFSPPITGNPTIVLALDKALHLNTGDGLCIAQNPNYCNKIE